MTDQALTVDQDDIHYCEVHPTVEATLRCNKCDRWMCTKCAVQTPVGYRCRECVNQVDKKFYKGTNNDVFIGAGVCAGLTALGAALIGYSGFIPIFLLLLLGLPVGGAISEVALRATGRRRARRSPEINAAAVVIGGLLGGLVGTYFLIMGRFNEAAAELGRFADQISPPGLEQIFTATVSDISLLLFIGIVAFAVYSRFRMR